MIEQIQEYATLIGLTIGVVLIYLWREARNASRIHLELIQLNEQLSFDTPAFLSAAWPLLSKADLRGMRWHLDWYGTIVEGTHGNLDEHFTSQDIQVGEIKLTLSLYAKKMRGERRYFSQTLIETFLLLLRTDMLVKADTTTATFDRMAKLNLFLQHDMKNIAQFIQLMADQVTTVVPGKEAQILAYLRVATPLIRQRADHIVRTLTVGPPKISALSKVDLTELMTLHAHLYHLDCEVSGRCTIATFENILDSALDNIFKNYSDISLRAPYIKPQLSVLIVERDSKVEITISACNLPSPEHLERLFEPFWSSAPEGLGIGLYQAKQMLELCHGKLSAQKTVEGQLAFQITLPLRHI